MSIIKLNKAESRALPSWVGAPKNLRSSFLAAGRVTDGMGDNCEPFDKLKAAIEAAIRAGSQEITTTTNRLRGVQNPEVIRQSLQALYESMRRRNTTIHVRIENFSNCGGDKNDDNHKINVATLRRGFEHLEEQEAEVEEQLENLKRIKKSTPRRSHIDSKVFIVPLIETAKKAGSFLGRWFTH